MPKYRVSGTVVGNKYLGEFEADSPKEAADKALEENGSVSLCHQCSSECEDAEVDVDLKWGVELIEDDEASSSGEAAAPRR